MERLQKYIFLGIFITSAAALAQDSGSGSDKLDIKKLEEKYWAPKDTDLAVVQNRTYTKAKRPFLSLSYGPLMNDPYLIGRMTSGTLGYYFSERFGVEIAYEKASTTKNGSVNKLEEYNGLNPNYNRLVDYKSLNVLFVPFYAKMSFLDRKILYFDMQFALGVGQTSYDSMIDPAQGGERHLSATGFNLDFTQQLFFHKHAAIRLDIKNKWTPEELNRYRIGATESESSRSLESILQQDTTILLGVTLFY